MTSKPISNAQNRFGYYWLNLLLGILGMAIACYGNLLPFSVAQKICYFVGALLLLLSSILEKQLFFIVLQIIIASGAGIALLTIPPSYKAAFPIVLSILAIVYFVKQRQLQDKVMSLGVLGIAVLAAGYAITKPSVYFLGASLLMVYSFLSYHKGVKIALLWAVLNAVFAITAALAIYHT